MINKLQTKKNSIIFLILSVIILNHLPCLAVTIKLKNGIQYINSKIILEDKVFINKPEKLEVEVSLGNSSGRILINYEDIYDIEHNESLLKPVVSGKSGEVKILDLTGNTVSVNELSPLDSVITGPKSYCDISFYDLPSIRLGANSKLECKIDLIDPSVISTGLGEEAVPAAVAVPSPENPAAEVDPEDNKKEEYVFFLDNGELSGIFNKKKEGAVYSAGFLLDVQDAFIVVKSPKFYIKNSIVAGSSVLTLLAVDGDIRFTVKKLGKTFQIRSGQFVVIYDGDRVQNRMNYTESPEMKAIYDKLNSME